MSQPNLPQPVPPAATAATLTRTDALPQWMLTELAQVERYLKQKAS